MTKERLYDGLLMQKPEIEGMMELARTDPGMYELLAKAKVYYALKGKPSGPTIWAYKPNSEERRQTLMNTPYGL
jgi:hypothetical protein